MTLLATIRRQLSNSVLIRLGLAMALLVGLFIVAGQGSPVYADTTRTIDVDAIADDNPDGGCTLREAIDVANNNGGAGLHANGCAVSQSGSGTPITYEINLPAYTYTLTGAAGEDDNESGDLDLKANVILNGQGVGNTILDGGQIDRVLHLDPFGSSGHVVELSGITVQNGLTSSHGAGIYTRASTLNISSCTVSGNETTGGGSGGGLACHGGGVNITGSTFSKNQSLASGGAIWNTGTMTIASSTIEGNRADSGGGINNEDTMTITHSIVSDNRASGWGGGIRNGERLYLTHSTVYSNTAENVGGGIAATNATTITHSTIYSNTTAEDGGGIWVQFAGTKVDIINSTLSANRADLSGGGLYHKDGSSNLSNVTITDNVADEDMDGAGAGGGISLNGGEVTVKNTILAGNLDKSPGRGSRWPDCYGDLTSGAYNLVGNLGPTLTPCSLTSASGDLTGIPASLDALQDNGGATETHALLTGSPAIDHIPEGINGCGSDPLDEDQRGVPRPQGEAACDIGAYEASAVLTIEKMAAPETYVAYHGAVTYTIVLSNTGVVRGNDVQLRDTLPDEVDFAAWLQQPTWASVADDEITWAGTVPTDTPVTFVFVVSHTGDFGDVVLNSAVYSHTTSSGNDDATFTVESGLTVYLPLVLRQSP